MFSDAIWVALIAAAASLALELLRSILKERDARREALREKETRKATEDTASQLIAALKAEVEDSRRSEQDLRAMVNLLLTQGAGRRVEGGAPTRSHGESR